MRTVSRHECEGLEALIIHDGVFHPTADLVLQLDH